eukprot:364699-Chlamydomonas_euryale.AAC.7
MTTVPHSAEQRGRLHVPKRSCRFTCLRWRRDCPSMTRWSCIAATGSRSFSGWATQHAHGWPTAEVKRDMAGLCSNMHFRSMSYRANNKKSCMHVHRKLTDMLAQTLTTPYQVDTHTIAYMHTCMNACGEVYGRFVPQSVTSKDGQALDVDIVVNEILNDGDELYVEYSNGPQAYKIRWEGRPRTPPFKWGEEGAVVPAHDVWLMELNLEREGLLSLVDMEAHTENSSGPQEDLQEVKKLLVEFAAPLQYVKPDTQCLHGSHAEKYDKECGLATSALL